MRVRLLVFAMCLAAAAASVVAQSEPQPQPQRAPTPRVTADQPAPAPATPPVATPAVRPPRREGQPINIKVEFTITDQRAGSPAIKRTITLVVADGMTGMIRSQADVLGIAAGVPLNVDTAPELLADGKIRLGFNLQYDWSQIDASTRVAGAVTKTAMHDSVSLILESGKPMIAAQSADPIGDRQVTVEVKATIMK
jgi:opacity protein-like surface antigen